MYNVHNSLLSSTSNPSSLAISAVASSRMLSLVSSGSFTDMPLVYDADMGTLCPRLDFCTRDFDGDGVAKSADWKVQQENDNNNGKDLKDSLFTSYIIVIMAYNLI